MRFLIAAALLVAMTASSANASVLGSILRKGAVGDPILNGIEDNNAEIINKGAGNTDLTRFEIGDSVTLYLQMETITSSDGFYLGTRLDAAKAGGDDYVLLAKGTFTITDMVETGDRADFEFEGSIDFAERTDGVGFDFSDGIAATEAVYAGADYIMTIGTLKADDFVVALDAPIFYADFTPSGSTVDADFGLSLIAGGGDLGLVPNSQEGSINDVPTGTFHTIVGSTQAKSALNPTNAPGGADDKFDILTNTNINLLAQVPEPGSMAVFAGLALCGGLRSLRARRASK